VFVTAMSTDPEFAAEFRKQVVGPPGIGWEYSHDSAVMTDHRRRKRMREEPAFGAGGHAEEPGDVFDLLDGAGCERPLVEAIGPLQH